MMIDDGRGGKVEITVGVIVRTTLYICMFSVLLFGRRLLPGNQFVLKYLNGPHVLLIAAVLALLVWHLEERVLKRRAKDRKTD